MVQILIADDNEVARGIVGEMLQNQEGWNVCAKVGNGSDAVSQAIALKPDIAILDLMMPQMDGLSAAREISRTLPLCAIFIYTLHDGRLIDLEAKKAGVRRVISKMSSPEDLVEAVRQVLEERRGTPSSQRSENIGAAPSPTVPAEPPAGDPEPDNGAG
jgi:two-component system, NarL family, response regulator DesR